MRERLVVVVGYDEATLLDIACVTSSLHAANRIGAGPAYRVSVAAPPETLRQAFVARYGISPSRYRATQAAQLAH